MAFPSKKKAPPKYGEDDSDEQQQDPKAAGKKKPGGLGIMIAVGRPKGPPPPPSADDEDQDAPPSHMPSGAGAAQPQHDMSGTPGPVPPHAVHYTDESQRCHLCEYMQGENCQWLQMPVSPQGNCELFEAKSGPGEQQPGEESQEHGGGMPSEGPPQFGG